jgi:hypothetical protein
MIIELGCYQRWMLSELGATEQEAIPERYDRRKQKDRNEKD